MHLLWLGMKIFGLTIAVFVVGFTIVAVKDWRLHQMMARDLRKQAGTEGWCRFLDWIVLHPMKSPAAAGLHNQTKPRRRAVMHAKITLWTGLIAGLIVAAVICGVARWL